MNLSGFLKTEVDLASSLFHGTSSWLNSLESLFRREAVQIIQGCSFLLGAFQKGSCLTVGLTFVPNITAYQQLDARVKVTKGLLV